MSRSSLRGESGAKMTLMARSSGLITADELMLLPRGQARYELLNGELRTMTPSGHVHGKLAARVAARLLPFVEENALGEAYGAETGFMLRRSPDTVRAPDAAFVSKDTLARTPQSSRGYFLGAPDLAVEVLSPDDSGPYIARKISQWIESGCRVVVVVDPARLVVTVHRAGVDVQTLGSGAELTIPDLLPGWTLPLDWLFR